MKALVKALSCQYGNLAQVPTRSVPNGPAHNADFSASFGATTAVYWYSCPPMWRLEITRAPPHVIPSWHYSITLSIWPCLGLWRHAYLPVPYYHNNRVEIWQASHYFSIAILQFIAICVCFLNSRPWEKKMTLTLLETVYHQSYFWKQCTSHVSHLWVLFQQYNFYTTYKSSK